MLPAHQHDFHGPDISLFCVACFLAFPPASLCSAPHLHPRAIRPVRLCNLPDPSSLSHPPITCVDQLARL